MLRKLSVSVVLGLMTLGVADRAHAGWGSWGGSHGGYGSDGYGGFGGSTGGSYGGSYGGSVDSYGSHGSWGGYASGGGSHGGWGGRRHHGHGLLARLFGHRHQRRHSTAYASHGSWGGGGGWGGGSSGGGSWGGGSSGGGGWGGYGSSGYGGSGGSYGGWGYGGGSHGSVGGAVYGGEMIEGTIIDGAPAAPAAPAAPMESEPMPPAPDEGSSASVRKGILVVSVPADATILVNGEETRSTGAQRRYVSHGLKRGESYRYVVKAIAERNGEQVEQTKVAMLRAGRTTALDFDFNGESIVETSLTLNVPEDAEVYLSGHETTTTGEQRRFSTTRIQEGQKWADYLVRVIVERDGREMTEERRVTLNGGDQAELNFDFADTELASVR